LIGAALLKISVREDRRGNQEKTIQRNWPHMLHKTKKNKAKTQHNTEKLATYVTQDEEKQSKNTTQYVLDTTIRKQTQITKIRHAPSYKQLEVKMDRTSFFMRKS